MGLIFEGPDGSGKTTLAEYISSVSGVFISHSGGPPKNKKEAIGRVTDQLKGQNKIFDRYFIISEHVYGPILRGKIQIPHQLKDIFHPIVYCRPSIETIINAKLSKKPHKSESHIEEVKNSIEQIIDRYDAVMKRIVQIDRVPVIVYNRDNTNPLEFLPCVESIWPLIRKQ